VFAQSGFFSEDTGWSLYANPTNGNTDLGNLRVKVTTVGTNGQSHSTNVASFGGYWRKSELDEVGGGSLFRQYTATADGSSIYKWIWDPSGTNAYADPPQLYALTAVGGGCSIAGRPSSVKASYTFGYTAPVKQTAVPSTVNWTYQYKIVPATHANVASVTITPTMSATIASTAGSKSSGEIDAGLSTWATPILLTAPWTMGRPDLGDGSNQFVYGYDYSGDQSDSSVDLPAMIGLTGSFTPGETFAMAHCGIAYDLPAESKRQPSQMVAESGAIGFTTGTPKGGSFSGLIYTGLPVQNSGFGNHVATLMVDGKASEQAHFQTFYQASLSTWPGTDKVTPNWYHYYSQVYPASGPYSAVSSADTQCLEVDGKRVALVEIGAQADQLRVFGLNPQVSPNVIWLGTLYLHGILGYIDVCAHEAGHRKAWLTPGIMDFLPDPSGHGTYADLLPSWKATHHFATKDPESGAPVYDTTGAYGGMAPPDTGDDECIADIQALRPVLSNMGKWQDDWADTGLQYQSPYFYYPPGMVGSEALSSPDFFLGYTPNTSLGNTVAPKGAQIGQGAYAVRTLADLQAMYPRTTILTSLGQLAQ
jgi:hypothetical protein